MADPKCQYQDEEFLVLTENEYYSWLGDMEERPGHIIHQAVAFNNVELLESLLQGEEKEFVDHYDNKDRTALYKAVEENQVACCHLLLDSGADPNIKCGPRTNMQSPLHAAATNNHVQLVGLLLEFGGNWYAQNKDGLTALEVAQKCMADDVVHIIEIYAKDREKLLHKACVDRDLTRAKRVVSQLPRRSVSQVISKGGPRHHSFLFKACEEGDLELAEFLLDSDCDIGIHPMSGQSPLHAACASGKLACAQMVLEKFPELINAPTIEGILPLHTACIVGNLSILKLLLNFNYPKAVMKRFKEPNGDRMYRLGLSIVAKDGHGRTPLHIGCMMIHPDIVDTLLKYKVKVTSKYNEVEIRRMNSNLLVESDDGESSVDDVQEPFEQMGTNSSEAQTSQEAAESRNIPDVENKEGKIKPQRTEFTETFSPVAAEIDSIDLDGNSALHVIIKHIVTQIEPEEKVYHIAEMLLYHGANPDKPMVTPSGNMSPVNYVCGKGHSRMVEMLLNYNATDPDAKAFTTALKNGNEDIIGVFLKSKNHVDTNYKVNSVDLAKLFKSTLMLDSWVSQTVTLKRVWPNVGVYLEWHGLRLDFISKDWLLAASKQHNRSPRGILPKVDNLPFFAITRIDVSDNQLTHLPEEFCQLPSLRVLNVSNNRIKWMPGCEILVSRSCSCMFEDCGHMAAKCETIEQQNQLWKLPVLEEINLQNNKLSTLPTGLLHKDSCPSLRKLNASHNELVKLPSEIWASESLVEINVSHNQIDELAFSDQPSISRSSTISSGVVSDFDTPDPITETIEETVSVLTESVFSPFTAVPVSAISHHEKLQIKENTLISEEQIQKNSHCQLSDLNLSHNKLKEIPNGLACVTSQLSKLNLAHNQITSMVSTSSLPAGITELDLSFNQLEDWASQQLLLEFINSSSLESAGDLMCYSRQKSTTRPKSRTLKTASKHGFNYCPHRSHTQLEKLRLLKLNNNQLVRFTMYPKQKDEDADSEKSSDLSGSYSRVRTRSTGSRSVAGSPESTDVQSSLYFPNLSVLDLSHNLLSVIEKDIALLTQLTELRLAHNDKLIELPPEMGLLKKLWNLDISGCPVQQTLQSLLGESIKRTVVVLNYLKSVKENGTVYNHMKLMFVGVQGIGKTSLLERLQSHGVRKGQTQKKNWSQRMGQSSIQNHSQTGETISTVGVDIGDLTLKRNNKEVVFSTWDFGGQREYYATHQYFLSKRSLYLVVWKLTDGEMGVHQILQWLVNIQARAPNSPVIIVGTHLDMIDKKTVPSVDDLRQLIYDKYACHTEPDRSGLPRVLAVLEVITKKKFFNFNYHISDLVNAIVRVATEEPLPGSKGGYLLEQKVPAIYVNLEGVVREIAHARKREGKDPVLHAEQYKVLVMHKMDELRQESFRDMSELHQATQFLHENGVLLHYNDVSLQDIYFLDPQWLCDVLANVVTIREINSLAKRGIMRTDDLKVLFRNAVFRPEDIKTYVINLLNKFEVALQWDDQNLLIPSMLPAERDVKAVGFKEHDKIPVLGSSEQSNPVEKPVIISGIRAGEMNFKLETTGTAWPSEAYHPATNPVKDNLSPAISVIPNPSTAIVRLYLMSYFPSGFWPRLITRLLGDPSFYATALSLYNLPDILSCNDSFMKTQGTCPWWQCWQTGLKLKFLNATILKIKEVVKDSTLRKFCDYRQCELLTQLSSGWEAVDVESISILEIVLPNEALNLTIQFPMDEEVAGFEQMTHETVVIRPNPQVEAVILTKIVEHIDTLLEDWYPDLGSRFVQNSKGMYLITRLVPCIRCLVTQAKQQQRQSKKARQVVGSNNQKKRATVEQSMLAPSSAPTSNGLPPTGHTPPRQNARNSCSGSKSNKIFGVCVESCIMASGQFPYAPSLGCKHSSVSLTNLAPDVVFQDVGEQFLIESDLITRDRFLGKGAFGAVYAGSVIHKHTGEPQPVAMKMMQPVEPDKDASVSLKKAYQVEMEKWNKNPMKHSCESYLNLRKELSILLSLQHDHIVGILGISLHPLCLVLNLAPMGSLADQLCDYKRIGNKLSVYTVQQVIVQVASALGYLHSNQIIYRDLKSENVLVWSFPPYDDPSTPTEVDVRLADYGVSRSVLPTGTKGLAGTPPFIAPEIIQHNGEESYTEKVDCFSFGMFLFELLTLRTPFEGDSLSHWAIRGHKDSCVVSGLRPAITSEDHVYPSHIFDLMTLCWSQEPQDRPSANAIKEIAQRPEFCHLYQVLSMEEQETVICAVCAPHVQENDFDEDEPDLVSVDSQSVSHDVWVSSHKVAHSRDGSPRTHQGQNVISMYTVQGIHCTEARRLELSGECQVSHMCVTGQHVWCADNQGIIHIYSVHSPKELLTFPVSSRPGVKVKSLVYASGEKKVYIVLDNGGFSVCDCYQEEEGATVIKDLVYSRVSSPPPSSLVRMECPGNGRPIHCMLALTRADSNELWCGQDQGKLSMWYLGSSATETQAIKLASHPTHNQYYNPDVYIIAASPEDNSTVWTYVYPGTVIYRWDVGSRQISHSADLTTYIPSLPDKEFQKYVKRGKIDSINCQVTALCSHAGHLFTSTTLGCILVLDADTMNPVSVLHSHLSTVRLLLPLTCVQGPPPPDVEGLSASSSAGSLSDECQSSPVILSIGKGYQDMIERLIPNVNVLRNKDAQFMLLWKAEGWAYTGKVGFAHTTEQ